MSAALSSSAAELLRQEAQAIVEAADRLDPKNFEEAVELVARCSGAVATIGAGTSGIVARKIAATLTSTGTRALFVHPTDALHGGLGVIGGEEVVIAVSNSGETEEISALLPYLRTRGVKLIAIVGNLDSSLAKTADVALDSFAEREAGPHGLVPTASVAVALAIGDALALTVMEAKGVTREAFAANHPSGRLGRRLTLRVRDVMHAESERPPVGPQTPFLEVVASITDRGLGAVSIVGENGALLGIVTDGDVRRTLQRSRPDELANLLAEEVMTAEPVVIGPNAMAYEALQLMENRASQIAVLPVVDERRCVGLVRLHDLVRIGL
ncbi:MAG: KpsF/GutQ family sugar-phosphate isomerase [Gaiellaceae bacterium]